MAKATRSWMTESGEARTAGAAAGRAGRLEPSGQDAAHRLPGSIFPDELHEDLDLVPPVRARPVKVEHPDRKGVAVPGDARVDRLRHDSVHAGEGVDVQDPVGAL